MNIPATFGNKNNLEVVDRGSLATQKLRQVDPSLSPNGSGAN